MTDYLRLGVAVEEIKTYRDLRVWRNAIELVKLVYRIARSLPAEEKYAPGDQLRRAAVSIPANIAEGQARQHRKVYLQHLAIAKGSLAEVDTLLVIAHELGYLSDAELQKVEAMIREVRMPLDGLLTRLQASA